MTKCRKTTKIFCKTTQNRCKKTTKRLKMTVTKCKKTQYFYKTTKETKVTQKAVSLNAAILEQTTLTSVLAFFLSVMKDFWHEWGPPTRK